MPTYTRHPRVEDMGLTALASSSDQDLSTFAAVMDDLQAMTRRRYNRALALSHDQGLSEEARQAARTDELQAMEQLTAHGISRVPVDLELSLRRAYRAELNRDLESRDLLTAGGAATELLSFERP